jgi:hypothetical protein
MQLQRTLAVVGSMIACTVAVAQPFTFTRIVDSNTPVPGGTGTFNHTQAFWNPTVSDGNIVFVGLGRGQGIYRFARGVLSVVADNHTPVPNGAGNFNDFQPYPPDVSGSNVAFRGVGGGNSGVFARFSDAALTVVADRTTRVPDSVGTFNAYNTGVSIDGQNVAFVGSATSISTAPGIYARINNVLRRVADINTPIPGGNGANFLRLGNSMRVREGIVTFAGSNLDAGLAGIYRQQGDTFATLVDRNTPVPDGRGSFSNFTGLSINSNDVAFSASNTVTDFSGLFKVTNGALHRIVDDSTPIPGFDGLFFSSAAAAEIADGTVVFREQEAHGVWLESAGNITPIVTRGSIVDGKTVREAIFWANGRDGNQVAVTLYFEGDSETNPDQAIYLVTIPGPGVGALIGGATIVGLGIRNRR